MSLISNLIQENVTNTASEAALSTTSRGFGDATMGEENIQDEGSEIFSVKDTVMAPLRGLEGFAQSIYNLGDALTFDALPDWDRRFLGKSETVVGGLVEGATQFLTAFVPIGGVLGKAGQGLGMLQKGAKGLEAAGALAKASSGVQKAASIGRQALQGGIADFIAFDGQDARLSNLIETVPALRNPVTEYLQADPNDGELEGRFKNVIEGLFLEAGVQTLAPLFTRGVKAVKEYKSKVNAGADPDATAKEVADLLKSEVGEELKGLNPASAFDRAEQVTAGNVAVDASGAPMKTVAEPKGLPANSAPVTLSNFKNPDEFYRVVRGDAAFQDIVESGLVKTNTDTKISDSNAPLASKLAARPTAFPSFAKGSVSEGYIKGDDNHYIITTSDESLKPSTRGRHGKGSTMFPTDKDGNPLKSLEGSKVDVYKHTGSGNYELVYSKGKLVSGSNQAVLKDAATLATTTAPRTAEGEAPINLETGLPFETVKGGEQAVNTSLYNAISESKTIEQFDENLQKFADLIPYGKYDPRDQKYSAAQIKSNYAAAGIDPKVYDQLVASTTPEVFGRIMIKQDILKNVVRDSGEKLLALRTKTEGLTGFELKKAEELMFDELGRFERSLSAYSAIGTGASQTMLARKQGLSGGNMGDAKKPAKEVLNNFDTTLETVINDFDGKSVDELTAEVDPKGKPRKVKTAEEVATDYDNRISELEGELAVQQKLAFDERDAADYKVTVDDNGNPIPPTKERVKTIKERDLEGKIDFYKKAQKEHTQLQAAINEYEAVRKMGPERLKELEDLQAARNDLKIQLPPSRAKEVKARTAELKRKLKEDPSAKLKAAELKEAERLAKLTDAQKAQLEELRNQRSYAGKDAPEVEAKAIKEIDPELAGLRMQIAEHKAAIKEASDYEALVKELERVSEMTPAQARKEASELKASKDLIPEKPVRSVDQLRAEINTFKANLVKAGKEDPAAKLKAAEEAQAKRLAALTAEKRAQLEELQNQRSYAGKDVPEVEAKAIKAIDPELAGLKTQIAEHKAAIKEAADYEALVAKLEKLANTTPAQARKDAFELKARQALIPEKPVRSIDKLRSDIATLQKNLVDAGKEQMTADQVRSHEDLLEFAKQRLGSGTVKELKQTLSLANSIDDIEKRMSMVAYVQNTSMGRKLFNATYEFWLNNLFSPATHVVASLGGLSVMILKNTEAIVGNTLVGDFGRVKAHFNALTTFQGFQEAMEATVLAMKNNDSTLKSSNVSMGNIAKGDTQFEGRIQGGAISPEAFGVDPDSGFGRTLKWFGKAARVNSTLLVGGDEFIKQITYRQYLRTEFYAEGLQKGYLSGKELTQYVEDKLSGMVLEGGKMYNEKNLARAYVNKLKQQGLTADMPEFSQALAREYEKNPFDKTKGVLGEAAYQYSLKSTFTNETGDAFTKSVMDILEAYPVLKFVVPFIKTPTNVLKFGLSRTPMGVAKDSILLATSAKYRKMYVEGSAEVKADMVGRMATASAFTAGVMYYISNNEGAITGAGPQNKEERAALKATGWQPYSIKIGDKYVSYNRLDPIATPLGIMADFSEFNKMNAPKSDSDAENGMSAFLVAMTYNLTDKSYLRGLNNLMNVARDPETYGPKLFQDIAGGIMPNTINKLQDTESKIILRESRSIADAVMRRTPVLSENLPPQRSFIGEPIYRDNPLGLLSAISPVYISSIKNDVVDKELSELKHGFAMPPSKINGIADLDMREFTNESGQQAYDRFLELSGTIEINGSTLRQSLSKMMKSSEYKSIPKDNLQDTLGTNSPRITAINRMVKAYRNRAQQEVFAEYPELYQKSKELTQMQRDYRLGKFDNQQ